MKEIESLVHAGLAPVKARLASVPGLPQVFEQCFLGAIRTAAWQEDGGVFLVTDDDPALWLRNSSIQMASYIRFSKHERVRGLLREVLKQQVRLILGDPDTSAFSQRHGDRDHGALPLPDPWVREQKYEIDSLCFPLWLAAHYYEKAGDIAWLDADFHLAMTGIVAVFERAQRNDDGSPFLLPRRDCPPRGDACAYGYLVPANYFAARALKDIALFAALLDDHRLTGRARRLRGQILQGMACFARVQHPDYGEILAYETDGLGNHLLMDEANIPSLLSLPYLGAIDQEDPLYQRTRRFLLSTGNTLGFQENLAHGTRSPRAQNGYASPITLCLQMMTTDDSTQQADLLRMLLATQEETGFLPESFHPHPPLTPDCPPSPCARSLFGECIWRLFDLGTLDEVLGRL
ncbi:MAG: glycoside hydrolase family 125 protein [Christensenellales bacterium]